MPRLTEQNPVSFRRKRLLLWLAILIFQLFTSFEIAAQYRFDSWTTENGLPQSSVNSIRQTRDGFLWLTTFGGLVRYNGWRFQVFNSNNTKGLTTSRFLNLFEASNGDLWITIEGSGITRYRGSVFTTYAAGALPDSQIGKVSENALGEVLVECGGRIFVFRNEKFTEFEPPDGEPANRVLQRMANGAVWYAVDAKIQKFENGHLIQSYELKSPVLRSFEDSQGRVWVAQTGENRLAMLKDDRLTIYTAKDGYAEFRFGTASEDRQGTVWFGTSDGLVRFQNNSFTHYRTADGLVNDGVTHIFQDREGTIWVGTIGGLSRLTERAVTAYSTADGLAADNIYSIYQDSAGRIWLGSWFGLTVYQNGRFENVGEQFGVADENLTALLEDRAGAFWIGTWSGEVKRVKNNQITAVLPAAGAAVRVIYEDKEGNVLVGTNGGLIKFKDEAGGSEIAFDNELSGKQILAIKEDSAGTLWIGTNAGLFRYKNGEITAFTEADGAGKGAIRAIYEDEENALWLGTYDTGLYRFKDGRFTHFTTNEGLFDNAAFQIVDDAAGNFWISCNLGIYRVKKSELNAFADGQISKIVSIPYNKSDGMLNSECNGGSSPAGIRAADGRIWFPTQKGAAVINPDAVPFNSQPPPVVVESITVDTKQLDLQDPVRVEPGQTNLEIHYSGLSFINPELVKFKYKLEDLDANWIDAGGRRTAFYSHLPPGKYLFRVIAANRDGVWNESGSSVEITVIAPFWRTWWFYGLVALIGVVALLTVFRLRLNELQRRHRVQQEFSRKLLDSQEQERKRIASEMHDSLGQYLLAIKNWALFGLNSLPQDNAAREYLTEVSETSSLALDEVREIAHNLRPYQLERLGLTNTLEYLLKAIKAPIRISSEIENVDGTLSKDAEIVFYRIVQESVNNVLKHSGAENLWISVKLRGENLEFVCRDDGRGFDFEAVKNSPKSGLGLNGIAERVKILNGEYQIISETGKGAVVSVKIRENR